MAVGDGLRDGEAEPDAICALRACFVGAEKRIGHARQFGFGDAGTVVEHFNDNRFILAADMHFAAVATSQAEFQAWVEKAKSTPRSLDMSAYKSLEQPSIKNPVAVYANVAPGLFEHVVDQFTPAPSVDTALNGSAAICTADGLPGSKN